MPEAVSRKGTTAASSWACLSVPVRGGRRRDHPPSTACAGCQNDQNSWIYLSIRGHLHETGEDLEMADDLTDMVSVRYMVSDVNAAIDFYTKHLGFTLRMSAAPAFAEVGRGQLRLLLSGPTSSAGRPMPDGTVPAPGGWNRIHLIVGDIAAEVARLRAAGLTFRNDIVKGPGGQQILLEDPSGNVVELFQPAGA